MDILRHSGASAACLLFLNLFTNTAYATAVSGQGTWETTLQARDFDGDINTIEGYFDTDLNITWLVDANYASTSGFNINGYMRWDSALSWSSGLDLYGITNWRLPAVSPLNGSTFNYNFSTSGDSDTGYNISAPGSIYAGSTVNELAHMHYNTLGNNALWNINGTQNSIGASYLTNTGPFMNLLSAGYWSGTESTQNSNNAWAFVFHNGGHSAGLKSAFNYIWLVHDGDVGSAIVPIPSALWLFGYGLLGLIGLARRK